MTNLFPTTIAVPIADPLGYRVASHINERVSPLVQPKRKQDSRNRLGELIEMEAIAESASQDHAVAQRLAQSRMAEELAVLISRMRLGDERALEILYDATVGKLFALAAAILRNAEDAEEVVCSTYSYAWANAARFDAERANGLGWLLMLCRSRALDRLRKRRLAGVTVDLAELRDTEVDGPHADDLLSLLQQRSRVRTALEKLAPDRRKLIALAFLRGWSHQEIASYSGLALGTVKSHIRRALAQLRLELGAE